MPLAVPEVPPVGATPIGVPPAGMPPDVLPSVGGEVTDDDRHRYGVLLDRAMERGLLGQADYEVRLGELARATSIDEMTAIVTELPAFTAAPATPTKKRKGAAPAPTAAMLISGTYDAGAERRTAPPTRRRMSPWTVLVIAVVFLVIFFVALTLFAERLVHEQHDVTSGLPAVHRVVTNPLP